MMLLAESPKRNPADPPARRPAGRAV